MAFIKISSPAVLQIGADENGKIEQKVIPPYQFNFMVDPDWTNTFEDFTYMIFSFDHTYGYQTDCPRSMWSWEWVEQG